MEGDRCVVGTGVVGGVVGTGVEDGVVGDRCGE